MKLKAVPCPCGCRKWLVEPLFYNVDSTLEKAEADELVKRWNSFESDLRARKVVETGKGVKTPAEFREEQAKILNYYEGLVRRGKVVSFRMHHDVSRFGLRVTTIEMTIQGRIRR